MEITSKQIDNFWKKVDKKSDSECWNWIGAKIPTGYGHLRTGKSGKSYDHYAHRFSWELHNGKIPKRIHILHKCDNPSCVNLKHLFLGTHQDNMRDRDKKNRFIPSFGNAKLSKEQVLYIKKNTNSESRDKLSRKFKVHIQTIHAILQNRHWQNIKNCV